MLTSKEQLLKEARERGYKPEILEKVYRLLDIFNQILSVRYLRESLVIAQSKTNLMLFHPLIPSALLSIEQRVSD